MGGGVWLMVLAVLVQLSSRGTQGLFCFLRQGAECTGPSLNIPGFTSAEVRRCCIDNNGFAFQLFLGDENCPLCIVIQWLNGTRFEGPERAASYQFAIGYIKGAGDVNAGDRTYSIMATSGALNPTGTDDFQVTPSTVTVTPTTPAIVEVNFIMDGIALEPNETVSLRFLPTVSVPIQEVLLDTIELTISDVDTVVVEFDYTSYTAIESQGTAVMFLILKRAIITQPVSVIFSTLPGTATDPADFIGQTNIPVTYAPSETEQNVSVFVVNDDIHESTETFSATLAAIPGSMVMIGAADTATATIIDDDTPLESTTAPPESATAPPESTTAPPESTATPESTTAPPESTTAPPESTATPESTTAPPESKSVGTIAGAVVAVGSVTIIFFSIVIIVIIVARSHRARLDLHKEESQGAAAMSGGASEVMFKEDIPMAECMAYGTLGTHPTSGDYSVGQKYPDGVGEGQQGAEGENVHEPVPL